MGPFLEKAAKDWEGEGGCLPHCGEATNTCAPDEPQRVEKPNKYNLLLDESQTQRKRAASLLTRTPHSEILLEPPCCITTICLYKAGDLGSSEQLTEVSITQAVVYQDVTLVYRHLMRQDIDVNTVGGKLPGPIVSLAEN